MAMIKLKTKTFSACLWLDGVRCSVPLTSSYLVVNRSVVAELQRAQTPRLPTSSSGGVHQARFLRRAAQLSVLLLQTCQVKGQSPLHRAQVVQQPQRDALRTRKMRQTPKPSLHRRARLL